MMIITMIFGVPRACDASVMEINIEGTPSPAVSDYKRILHLEPYPHYWLDSNCSPVPVLDSVRALPPPGRK